MREELKKVIQKEMDRLKHLGIIRKGLTSYSSLFVLVKRKNQSIKAKYRETRRVNYRCEIDVTNTPLICTSIKCNEYRTSYGRQIDTSRHK